MNKLMSTSIRQKYLRMTISVFVLFILTISTIFYYMNKEQSDIHAKQVEQIKLQEGFETLRDSLNNLFFRARGYYSFQNQQELELTYTEMKNVKNAISAMKTYPLTTEEKEITQELSEFILKYENDVLPKAVAAVKANDYEKLRAISKNGTNDSVNKVLSYAENYSKKADSNLRDLNSQLLRKAEQFSLILTLLFVFFFILGIIVILRILSDIIKPLEWMRGSIQDFMDGKDISYQQPYNRTDEIGVLSASFYKMVKTIMDNEEELTAQNEELVMQQDELQKQQDKLQNSLTETKKTKGRLERYNDLNHVLSFTLDKQQLSEAMLNYFEEVFAIDLGVLWLTETGEYALKGFTKSMFETFKEERYDYIKQRLMEQPIFTIKREADKEKGLAFDHVYTHDLYTSVRNKDKGFIAVLCLSRIGRPFSEEEKQDINGLLNRIHLAIDRIYLYDEAVHERTLNERIINNINEGIQLVTIDGTMVQHNHMMCKMLDCGEISLDDVVEKAVWIEKMSEQTQNPDETRHFFQSCLTEKNPTATQFQYTTKQTDQRVIDVYSAPIMFDGQKTGTIFVHRDITKAYEVDQMKTELVSTVSHELRTPLSSILGFTELILYKQLKPEKQKKYLETIYKEAKRLTNLINDFLDLQRMESGNQMYHMDKLSMGKLIVEVTENFRNQTTHHFIILDEAKDVEVVGDRDRLTQVMMNLIGNAVKFSPEGGDVTITLSNEANELCIAVKDEGIGIPQEDIAKLFEKFQRIDNSSKRKIGGTGLGLAICREIIEKHQGKIVIESEEGKGTTVLLYLPLTYVSANKTEVTEQESGAEKPWVMIVEDDVSLALLLSEELKMNGCKVIYHSTIDAALQEVKRSPLVGVIIDIMLGEERDGWDLVDLMKKDPSTSHIPIIISSALEADTHKEKLKQIDRYLIKPYPPANLSQAVLHFIERNNKDGVIFYPKEENESDEKE